MRPLYTAQQFLCTHAHLQQHIYPTAVDLPAAETIEVDFIRPSIEWERESKREREVGEIYLLGGTRYINVSASSTISDTTGTTNYECFIAAFFRDRANFTDFKVDRQWKKEIDQYIYRINVSWHDFISWLVPIFAWKAFFSHPVMPSAHLHSQCLYNLFLENLLTGICTLQFNEFNYKPKWQFSFLFLLLKYIHLMYISFNH